MALKSPSLFWRTFTLLILLIMITALAWIQSFRVFSEIPFSKTVSHQIVSTANLTRYALVTADVDLRPHLLRTLAYQEGLRVLPRESHDEFTPLVGTGNIVELVEAQTREVLGEDTILAGTVNGEVGLWVSLNIEGDDYWLMIRDDLLDPPFGTTWLWWAFVALVVGIAGATLLTQRTVKPLARLSDAAKRLGRGEHPAPLPVESDVAEIEAVNQSFNHMVQELRRADEDREVLLAGVSHDLRTPLTRMRLEIELADLPDYSREAMVSDLEQMEGILNQFMVYARRSNQPLERVDLGLATNDTLVDMRIRQKSDVVVETNITGNLFVMAQPMELKRAIQNLIVNADRYGRTPDTNTLELTIQVLAQGNDAVLRVADRGYGLPEEDMERVTRPFERGDRSRGGAKGAGLGLAIVSRVIQRAGGKLKLSANHPHGLIVELILPITNKRNEKPVVEDQTKPVDAVISSQDELLPIIQEKNGN